MEIIARFSHERLDSTKDNSPHLVVSLKAPTLDWVTKRPKVCVVPVIDLSGSMRGPKLESAKKSMLKLVDQLCPGDITGLIGFENKPHELVTPSLVTPEFKAKMREAINKLHPMGGTDLCSGALKALELVAGLDLGPQFLKRLILFTDGQPTNGITDQKEILRLLTENRGGISVSAFGYGNQTNDAWSGCDHDFLTQFSQQGQGNYAYVKDPDDSLTAFGRELGGLLSTYAQDIVVDIEPANGHQVAKAVTDIVIEQNSMGETEFKISDILSEETRHFVFEAKTLKQDKVFPRPLNLFTVKVTYTILTSAGKRETHTVETKAKAQFVAPDEAQTAPDKELDEVIAQAQVVRAQLDAEVQARQGRFEEAGSILDQLSSALDRRGHGQMGRVTRSVRSRLSSQAVYTANAGYLRSMSYGGTRGMGLSGMDAEAAGDLALCNVALSNSSMQETSALFETANVVQNPGGTLTPGSPFLIHPGQAQIAIEPPVVIEPAVDTGVSWSLSTGADKSE